MKYSKVAIILFPLFVLFYFLYGIFGPLELQIYNDTDEKLTDILIYGSTFTEKVSELERNSLHTFYPNLRGESGLKVEYVNSKGKFVKDDLAYLEGESFYNTKIIIKSNNRICINFHNSETCK